jgi:hypothetical protein
MAKSFVAEVAPPAGDPREIHVGRPRLAALILLHEQALSTSSA